MRKVIVCIIGLIVSHVAFGQLSQVRNEIEKIIKGKHLEIGFALQDLSTGDTLSIHGDRRFPMQSVFKFPIALAALNEVDKNNLALDQKLTIGKEDLRPGIWSPIEKKYPEGNVQLPLSEIIQYTVAQSDNVGCDLLLKILNGPSVVNQYIHSKGIVDIRIRNNEQEIQSSWEVQFNNWVTPKAMIDLLKLFNNKELLLPRTHDFLWETMAATSTGAIKNKLPKDAVVAHKTGTSGYNKEGLSAATNDVGIMLLTNGKRLAFALFVTNSKEAPEVNADIIASIGALLYAMP